MLFSRGFVGEYPQGDLVRISPKEILRSTKRSKDPLEIPHARIYAVTGFSKKKNPKILYRTQFLRNIYSESLHIFDKL